MARRIARQPPPPSLFAEWLTEAAATDTGAVDTGATDTAATDQPTQQVLRPPRLAANAPIGSAEAWAEAAGVGPLLGTDEVGRGPLCGPVVASAVVLRDGGVAALLAAGLHDSKRLSEPQREALVPLVMQWSLAHATVFVSAAEIDRMNILRASQHAMLLALEQVWQQLQVAGHALPRLLAVDGHLPVAGWTQTEQWPVVKGDSKSATIAAASVLAKVARDHHMVQLDQQFPGYGLAGHKGYPTAAHQAALRQLGPTPEHRRSFRGVVSDLERL